MLHSRIFQWSHSLISLEPPVVCLIITLPINLRYHKCIIRSSNPAACRTFPRSNRVPPLSIRSGTAFRSFRAPYRSWLPISADHSQLNQTSISNSDLPHPQPTLTTPSQWLSVLDLLRRVSTRDKVVLLLKDGTSGRYHKSTESNRRTGTRRRGA